MTERDSHETPFAIAAVLAVLFFLVACHMACGPALDYDHY